MNNFTLQELQNQTYESIEAMVRSKTQGIIQMIMEDEVNQFVKGFLYVLDENGNRAIVRNGHLPERDILTNLGEISVKVPRVRDNRKNIVDKVKFKSSIIPPYLRKTRDFTELIPLLYLKGISSNNFSEVISQILGAPVDISSSTVMRLTKVWTDEMNEWKERDFSNKEYAYWWADGVYFNVRGQKEKNCMLVIIGVTKDGTKELVALEDGFRESELAWERLMRRLKLQGLRKGPFCATGDGSLGFWNALSKLYPETKHQRCWVHRMANVLDKLPKSIQPKAKTDLHEIYMAETKKNAEKAFDTFVNIYEAKYPGAVKCLLKTKKETMTFYDFPKYHWRHIRSSNPIESTFSTIRLRTYKTKNCCSLKTLNTMVYKLFRSAEKNWRRIHKYQKLEDLFDGVIFEDGEPKVA